MCLCYKWTLFFIFFPLRYPSNSVHSTLTIAILVRPFSYFPPSISSPTFTSVYVIHEKQTEEETKRKREREEALSQKVRLLLAQREDNDDNDFPGGVLPLLSFSFCCFKALFGKATIGTASSSPSFRFVLRASDNKPGHAATVKKDTKKRKNEEEESSCSQQGWEGSCSF